MIVWVNAPVFAVLMTKKISDSCSYIFLTNPTGVMFVLVMLSKFLFRREKLNISENTQYNLTRPTFFGSFTPHKKQWEWTERQWINTSRLSYCIMPHTGQGYNINSKSCMRKGITYNVQRLCIILQYSILMGLHSLMMTISR